MDVRSLFAAQTYAAQRPAVAPAPEAKPRVEEDFAKAAKEITRPINEGEQEAMVAMTEQADPHALVEALAQSELAVEAVVAVRNKVVEAYQEILRMPV
ncbi:flagellar hook-basal body complex protein FliE [Cognatishimia sp. F0-27]|uniref:flagellar hook-basal body complex protein FliE n=1 Tax=Cognatishimia sp. F0-27 TaxID=2816855 RepID=UPI001D0CBEF2|nr:flagellar hook-basal body complex protein FliE [Cognatishimia sp. F0-27]MCC1491216.1 flagellar hook-basal body complex protein FliE [Cognatishimia sp. F0-27]